jgi:hypothetical protein
VTTLSHTFQVAGTRKQLTYIAIAALVALVVTAAIVLPLTLTGSGSSRAAVTQPSQRPLPVIQYRGNGAAPELSRSALRQGGNSNVVVPRAVHSRSGMIPNWR